VYHETWYWWGFYREEILFKVAKLVSMLMAFLVTLNTQIFKYILSILENEGRK
jgi:hypothetical protein